MFKKRDNQAELLDDLSLQGEGLRENLAEFAKFNRWFGSRKALLSALDKIYQQYSTIFSQHKLLIGDLGCGGGDLLTAIAEWGSKKHVSLELLGIDANPCIIDYAVNQTQLNKNIRYQTLDVLSPEFANLSFDILCINSVFHHFSDTTLIALFKQLVIQTRYVIVINDLHRHWLSYFFIKYLAKLFKFSYLAKHDAPLSVLKAFRKNELKQLLREANITSYDIKWAWPFRWVVIIWCKEVTD